MFQTPLPRSDSSDAILLDLFGTFKIITIDGIFEGTASAQRTFISNIEAIANGAQNGSTFVSSFITSPASYSVLIQNFTWNKQAGDVSKIGYNLTLFQGGI